MDRKLGTAALNDRIEMLKDMYAFCHNADERICIEEDLYRAKQEALRAWFDEQVEMEGAY